MDRLESAFNTVLRENFLPDSVKSLAGMDMPVPIGCGQTNSQPATVRRMLEWLSPSPGEKILDVGSGSGWTTALLSYLVGPRGTVYAVEKVPSLKNLGEKNCNKAGVTNASFFEAGQTIGLPEYAPYNKILVSASAIELPRELLSQLKNGGRLVIPIKHSIYVINKINGDKISSKEHKGFVFVPLI